MEITAAFIIKLKRQNCISGRHFLVSLKENTWYSYKPKNIQRST